MLQVQQVSRNVRGREPFREAVEPTGLRLRSVRQTTKLCTLRPSRATTACRNDNSGSPDVLPDGNCSVMPVHRPEQWPSGTGAPPKDRRWSPFGTRWGRRISGTPNVYRGSSTGSRGSRHPILLAAPPARAPLAVHPFGSSDPVGPTDRRVVVRFDKQYTEGQRAELQKAP